MEKAAAVQETGVLGYPSNQTNTHTGHTASLFCVPLVIGVPFWRCTAAAPPARCCERLFFRDRHPALRAAYAGHNAMCSVSVTIGSSSSGRRLTPGACSSFHFSHGDGGGGAQTKTNMLFLSGRIQ